MNILEVILWIFVVTYVPVVACWWYVAAYYVRKLARHPVGLEPCAAWPDGCPAPALDVIVACHNEAAGIEACLHGLLRQGYPNFRVRVVDDRSTDGTADIVRRLAAQDTRIHLHEIRSLPAGWTGKTHALAQAAGHVAAEYLLFLDSDVDLTPHALNTVMHKVVADQVDFLSFWPRLELLSTSERLLTPAALVVLSMWALPRVPRADVVAEVPLGNGQFMLIRRGTYEVIGGHAGVADELAEDAVLAARAHATGARCWAGLGTEVYTSRRTGGWRRTVNALARVVLGSVRRTRDLWAGAQVLLAGGFTPLWVVPLAVVLLACGWSGSAGWSGWLPWVLGGLGLLHWLGLLLALRQAFALLLVRRGSIVAFPLGAVIVAGVLVWAAYLRSGRGTVQWGSARFRVRGSRVEATALPRP